MTLGDLRFPAPAIPKKLRWGHFSSIPGVFVRFPGAVAGRRTLRTLCFESRFSGVSSEKSAPGPLPCMAGAGNLRTPRAPNVNALRAKILTGGGSAMQLLSICSPVALLQLLREWRSAWALARFLWCRLGLASASTPSPLQLCGASPPRVALREVAAPDVLEGLLALRRPAKRPSEPSVFLRFSVGISR